MSEGVGHQLGDGQTAALLTPPGPMVEVQVGSPPFVSVIIATRNRPKDLDRCLESLAAVEYPAWELIVMDQGLPAASAPILAGRAVNVPVRHVMIPPRGLSVARNEGLAVARGDIIAFLDDDCTVRSSWLYDVVDVFARHPKAGLMVGSVIACEYDRSKFLLPTREIKVEAVLDRRSWREMWLHRVLVMGANMAMRRQTFERMGGFDEMLGAGAPLRSAEDLDYTYRLLLADIPVVRTPHVKVVHHGVRPHAGGAASRLIRDSAFGAGVAHMKLLRAGHPAAIALLLATTIRFVGWIKLDTLLRDGREFGAAWLAFYWVGLARSFRYRLDRRRLNYLPATNEPPKPR